MTTNKTNGKKDRNQTLVEYLTYEAGSSFMAIAQHKAERHKQTLAHVNQQSGEKIEAIACTALGVVVGVGGIMMGAVGLAVGGLAIAPFAGLALMARAKGEMFAAREHEFLRLNSQMLEYMAGMEQRGDLPTLDLADLYVQIFAERCHRNNLAVTPEVFKAALAGMANSRIGSKATVSEFAQAMETQTAMTLPIAPIAEPECYEPEPEAPQAAPFRFSAFGAIDVPATSGSSFDSGPVATLERTIHAEAPIGLPQQLIDVAIVNPYSTFIIGMSAAGKDITLYNLVKSLKERLPTSMFIGIDGKNHPGEKALWSDDIYDRTLHISMLDFVPDYHPKLINLLRDACEFPGGAIVTFSELNGIASSYAAAKLDTEWAEVAHYLRYLSLQGNAYGKLFLSTAQGLTLKELGISTSARGNIKFMMLANGSQFGFVDSATANTNVFSRKLISDQNTFTAACSRSTALTHLPQANTDIGVAYFHSSLNRWEPMPRLVNPGNDRGQAAVKPAPTATPTEPAKATRTEVGKALVAKAQALGRTEALQQVKQLNEIGQERSAFKVIIEALGISSKTAFCKLLGVEGGAKFQQFGEVYDWVVS